MPDSAPISPKAQADLIEGQEYTDASQLALQNEQFTQMSTAIKDAQTSREIAKSEATTAAVAGGGFEPSGSALDILRDSAQQGAITRAVGQEQGLVTEAGYAEQATSYNLMAGAANQAASAEKRSATGAKIGAGLQLALPAQHWPNRCPAFLSFQPHRISAFSRPRSVWSRPRRPGAVLACMVRRLPRPMFRTGRAIAGGVKSVGDAAEQYAAHQNISSLARHADVMASGTQSLNAISPVPTYRTIQTIPAPRRLPSTSA